jgi:hypothetical protein
MHFVLAGIGYAVALIAPFLPLRTWIAWPFGIAAVVLHLVLRGRPFQFFEEWLLAELYLTPGFRSRFDRRAALSGTWVRAFGKWCMQPASWIWARVNRQRMSFHTPSALKDDLQLAIFAVQPASILVLALLLGSIFLDRRFLWILVVPAILATFKFYRIPWKPQAIWELIKLFYEVRFTFLTYPDRQLHQQGLWISPFLMRQRDLTYAFLFGAFYVLVPLALAVPARSGASLLVLLAMPVFVELANFAVFLKELLYLWGLRTYLARENFGARTQWRQLVDRKDGSNDEAERNSIFLGLYAQHAQPVLIDRATLRAHMHVKGATGSGKTSSSLVPLSIQLMQPYGDTTWSRERLRRDPLLVIDLGGDHALFHAVRDEANRAGRKFRFFSVHKHHASDYFDPLQMLLCDELRDTTLASFFTSAFNLDYGLRYGAQYFTEQNLYSMLHALRELRDERGRAPTLAELHDFLRRNLRRYDYRNAEQILMCVDFLLDYETLNAPQHDQQAPNHIYMPRVLEDNEVVYFYLPALGEAVFVRQIAGLALYSLLTAAMQRRNNDANDGRRTSEHRRQAWVILDEFHELTGTSFEKVLVESRKYGLGLILANQSNAQLRHQDTDLSAIVLQGTSVQQYFTVDEDDMRTLQRLSGEADVLRQSISEGRFTSVSTSWAREPLLDTNVILEANGKRGDCLLRLLDGQGAAPFRQVQTLYPFSLAEYLDAHDKPLPRKPKEEPTRPAAAPQSAPEPDLSVNDQFQARARELWTRYQGERASNQSPASPPTARQPKQRKNRRSVTKGGP